MPKVLIETYGCTLNRADSDIMYSLLKQRGFEVEHGMYTAGSAPEYVIVNTCTVKKPTEQKILHRLKEMSRLNAWLIVTGCLASAGSAVVEKAAPNASILSTTNIVNVVEAIDGIMQSGEKVVYNDYKRQDKAAFLRGDGSVLARIAVSEGCISNCTFCETKFARGPLNSFSEELILRAVKNCVVSGAKEIELTSQDTGAYGADKHTNIAELVVKASEIEGDFMMRIGMMNPEHLHKYIDRIVEAYKSGKVFKFIHLPVQSGSESVLKGMERRYTVDEFRGYVEELRRKITDISIETDIIVGYPTESDEDFLDTVNLIDEVRPTFTNISKFCARPHARASELRQLENKKVKGRSTGLSRIVRRIQHEEFKKMVGRRLKVLVTEREKNSLAGRDDSYRPVVLSGKENAELGNFLELKVVGNTHAYLVGIKEPMH